MKGISIVKTLSCIVFLIGFLGILGWEFDIPILVQMLPNSYKMVYSTSLCVIISGVTLFLCDREPSSKTKFIYIFSSILLLLFGGVGLVQYVMDYDLGVDHLFTNLPTTEEQPLPARMAENTAVGFIFIALSFLSLAYLHLRYMPQILQTCVILAFTIGFFALLGYSLGLSFLYTWNNYTHMAINTSIAMTLIAISLWSAWRKTTSYQQFYESKDDKIILLTTVIILLLVASVSSLLGFVVSTKQDEITMEQFFQDALHDKADLLQDAIYRAIAEMNKIEQPGMVDNVFLKSESNDKSLSNALLSSTFSAIKIIHRNNVIYTEGNYKSDINSMSLGLPYHAKIISDNGLYLQLTSNRKYDIVLQWRIDNMTTFNKSINSANKEYNICHLNSVNDISCLSLLAGPNLIPASNLMQHQLALAIAADQQLILKGSRLNANKLLAYHPVGKLNFGILSKTDISFVYKSILFRICVGIAIIIVTVVFGAGLLYFMVAPLVRKVKTSELQFRSMFDSSAIGMAVISLNGEWLNANSALCLILGYSRSDLLNMKLTDVIHVDDCANLIHKMKEATSIDKNDFRIETRCYNKNHENIWVLLNATLIYSTNKLASHYICQIQDITKQKEYENKLHYQARHDILTGLVNRAELEDRMHHIITQSQRAQQKFAVFFLDLDKFKDINDTLGHDAGDRLLKVIAERLKSCVRKCDIVARLGGDEFVLVLTDLQDYKTSALFAERLISILLVPTRIKGQEIFATSSIGISFYPADGADSSTLIKNADHALYAAKNAGRNNYQFCESDVSSKIRERMSFESDLKNAIEKNEFNMCYLPQIDPTYQSVVGVEGLLRWQSDQYGIVAPDNIIPIAEETGLIIPLSEWVIKTTCEQVRRWQETKFDKLHLSVNISARHYMHERVIDSIVDNIEITKFDPKYLQLEINESLIMQDPNKTLEIIAALKRFGIKVVVDNFGTGYTSFTYLQDFNIDAVKIDRSIIKQIQVNLKREELIRAMISFAKDLEIKVIAEGVENQAQFDFLVNAGCDELQGYYICKPLSADELTQFLDKKLTHGRVFPA